MMRGIRGAISVPSNTKEEIWQAARTLVTKILSMNNLKAHDIGAIIFSSTKDLTAAYPSEGVDTLPFFTKNPFPIFDTQHTNIDDGRAMCIRVLILVDIDKDYKDIINIDID